jgi:PAS domain S-box-containing protein
MRVRLYVAAVTIGGIVAAVVAARIVPGAAPPAWPLIAPFAVLIVLAECLQVRYHYRDQVNAFNLVEGVMAPMLFVGSGAESVAAVAAAMLVAGLVLGNPPIKLVFNLMQWVLAAALGSIVVHEVARGGLHSTAALGAVIAGVITVTLVNLTLVSGVIRLAGGEQVWGRWLVTAHSVVLAGSIATGICLTAAYLWSPWTLVIAAGLIAAVHASGRAQAAVRADSTRLEGLQRATHALATSLDSRHAIPVFLAEARAGFEVQAAELVLFSDGETTCHRCVAEDPTEVSVRTGPHELATFLAGTTSAPVRITVGEAEETVDRALARAGHRGAIAVPLVKGGQPAGMLLLYDRMGMEGFEVGEVSVAQALGRTLVSFLERVELLAAIDGERHKLADILDSTSDGILTVDADGFVTSWNNGLVEMTGYAAAEMVGTRHLGLLRARDDIGQDLLLERWAELGAEALPAELQIRTQTGESAWLSCSYSCIPGGEGGKDALVIVARNITKARELDRLKDDFVAVVSHELRTPLVPIKGWAQTLLTRGDRLTEDQRRTAVQSILAQAQKLESLVLNILESSRIESGRVDRDGTADVTAIATRIVEDQLVARPDRQLRLRHPQTPCHSVGSALWVERAIANLVANAVKYSPDDQPVDIVVTGDEKEILVAVSDRGPGIAPDSQDRIFDRFERLEETRKQTGTGLGLYITRRLARAMGGDVSVTSTPGAGSTFLLRLPAVAGTRFPGAPVASEVTAANPRQRLHAVAGDESPSARVVTLR